MNIAHLITTVERGGAESALLSLCESQLEMGYRVTVFPLKGRLEMATLLTNAGVELNLELIDLPFFAQAVKIKKILREYKDFIVHAHLPRAEVLASLVAKRNTVLATRHNSEAFWPNAPFTIASSIFSRFVTKNFKCVIAISNSVRHFLISNSEVRNENAIEVVRYGYKSRVTIKPSKEPSVELSSSLVIGMISRLTPQKNLFLALDFVYLLKLSNLNVTLNVIGDGPEKAKLLSRCIELEIQDKVHFFGKTDNVFPFLDSIDVFLLTSNYEGFGLVLLEAIDAGKPILAPNNSSIPEVLGHNHPGIFESGNANDLLTKFYALFTERQMISDMLTCQQSRLGLFTTNRCFDSHDKIYRKVKA